MWHESIRASTLSVMAHVRLLFLPRVALRKRKRIAPSSVLSLQLTISAAQHAVLPSLSIMDDATQVSILSPQQHYVSKLPDSTSMNFSDMPKRHQSCLLYE